MGTEMTHSHEHPPSLAKHKRGARNKQKSVGKEKGEKNHRHEVKLNLPQWNVVVNILNAENLIVLPEGPLWVDGPVLGPGIYEIVVFFWEGCRWSLDFIISLPSSLRNKVMR